MNRHSFGSLCAIVFVALLIGGCDEQQSSSTIADTKLTQPGNYLVELTAAAIPPGTAQCANGRALISSWGNLFSLDLSTLQAEDITAKLPTPTAESSPGELYQILGDPQLVRLKDGSVVLLRQGTTTAPFKGPTPAWSSYNNGQRGYLFIWRTENCGASWQVYHPIDSQDFLGGNCAWPQALFDANGKVSVKFFGGYDLSQLYADPWNGNLYLTTSCTGGTEPAYIDHYYAQNLLFTLRPGDADWREPVVLPWDPPLVMTSTKSGTLWLYHWETPGPQPQGRLFISEDQGQSVISNPGLTVIIDGTKPTDPINQTVGITSDKLAGNQAMLTTFYSLSRSGDNQVRLAIPHIENGRQVLYTAAITKLAGGNIAVKPLKTFTAEAADASIIQHAFIETDRVNLKQESNVAALYWLESSPSTGQIQVRYSLVKSNLDWSEPKMASSAPWKANFAADDWAGDYIKGAFYFRNGEPHFFLVWPQSEAEITVPNVNIHYAVVKGQL